ncbi:MAG: hypothetical protein UZ17_ACD001002680 [Acidobacteria bacterium OLB17]|nr:MAG: hypothetical protein UZ17_ACD001002680 [Acidobacteria bacterium OLB17]MCZ2390901.1 hypothetical protein [Acidobacteriota bacterium]
MLSMVGSLLVLVGAIWLIVTAIQTGRSTGEKALWALANSFCQPIAGIVFYFVQKQGLVPLLLVIAGYVLIFFGGGLAVFSALGR